MYFPRVEFCERDDKFQCLEDGDQWSVKIKTGERIEFVNTEK